MTVAQILAVVIFVAMFGLIVSEKIERHLVSLGCGLLMIVLVFGLSMHSMPAIWNTLALRNFLRRASGIRQRKRRNPRPELTGRRFFLLRE